jgi:rSAM/selenodomain-associated transferase 1
MSQVLPAQSSSPAGLTLLFLKAPQAGKVKTRLAKSIGDNAALTIYRELAEAQIIRLKSLPRLEIHFTPTEAKSQMIEWLGDARPLVPQVEGDLGTRLGQAINRAFGDRNLPWVCAVGADCPGLKAEHILQAGQWIEEGSAEVVFGPAEDGGYYLVALKKPFPALFDNISWSTESTLAESLAAASLAGKRIKLLPSLRDVDTYPDLEYFPQLKSLF